jgi:hypothetical protein
VYLPNPAIANEKIDGHIMLKNNPPLIKAKNSYCSVVNKPISMAVIPIKPNIIKVLDG